jgi:hypothetical protein
MYAVLYPFLDGRAQRTSDAYDLKALTGTTGAKVEFEREKSGHHHERVGSIFASVVWTLADHNIVG